MAEAEEARANMSIIPYSTNRQVVLRHSNSIVEWDRSSRQLVLRNSPHDVDVDAVECPYCHRPFGDEHVGRARNNHGAVPEPAFVSPEYFRMLHNSRSGSVESSVPPSPRRRLVQTVRSGHASPAQTPPGAEFVGSTPAPPSSTGISPDAFSQDYFRHFFIEEAELGRGGRGVVLLVKHILHGVSLGYFACKRVPVGDDQRWLEKVLVEVRLLQRLAHNHLVAYRHVWLEDVKLSNFGPSVPCAFILQQYCNGGDLQNYILKPVQASLTTQQLKERIRRRSKGQPELPRQVNETRKLQFDEIYRLFKDISSGLRYLHSQKFLHRDLKPSNCLLHETDGELRVLISDFGEVQSADEKRKSTGATGTISYCAPEVLVPRYEGGPLGEFSFKSDIFSLGMILYFMCFARLPYRNADVLHEEREDLTLLRAEISEWAGFNDVKRLRPDLPDQLYSFLKRLLAIHPEDRPTAEETYITIKSAYEMEDYHPPKIRRTNSGSSLDDHHRQNPRIVPIGSPPPAGPSTASRSPVKTKRPTLNTNRHRIHTRSITRQNIANRSSRNISGAAIETSDDEEEEEEEGEEAQNTTGSGSESDIFADALSRPPTSSDLILRPKPYPPSPLGSISPRRARYYRNHHHHHHHPPPSSSSADAEYIMDDAHLLPPPPPATTLDVVRVNLTPSRSLMFRTSILLFKVVSLTQPCFPRAVNPWISYPLFIFAALEFGVDDLRLKAMSMFAHVGVLIGATLFQKICVV